MSLTLENANQVKQRARSESRRAGQAAGLRSFWHYLEQLGNPDLQFVAISALQTADVVLANVACKLYAILITKPAASTVDSWFKVSDHATVAAAAADVVVKCLGTGGGGRGYAVIFHDGLKLGTGATAGAHTAVDGNSKSLVADAPVGFAIVGAA
jgi:hypothetical protein